MVYVSTSSRRSKAVFASNPKWLLTWIKGQSATAAAGSSPVHSLRVPVFQSEHTGTYQHPHRRHFNAAAGFEWFG